MTYIIMGLAALVGGIIQPLTGFGAAVVLMVPAKTPPLVDVPLKILYSGYIILKNDTARGIYLWIIMLPSVPR